MSSGLEDSETVPPKPQESIEKLVLAALTTVTILILGGLTIYFQCVQLKKQFRELAEQRHRRLRSQHRRHYRPTSSITVAKTDLSSGKEIRQSKVEMRKQQNESFNVVASELEYMKQMQRDVKNQLASLENMVERASHTNQKPPATHETSDKKDD